MSWREERHLTASWSLNTDLGRLLTQFLSLWIRPCSKDLIVLTQSDKDSNSGSWSTSPKVMTTALVLGTLNPVVSFYQQLSTQNSIYITDMIINAGNLVINAGNDSNGDECKYRYIIYLYPVNCL